MHTETTLPEGFEALSPFVSRWAPESTAARAALRDGATQEELKSFYQAASPLLDQALDFLDQRPVEQLSAPERRLMNMMLSFAHASLAVEIQGSEESKHATWRRRMHIERSPADRVVAGDPPA